MSPTRRRSEPLSPADAVMVRTDEPTNMTMITGVMSFDTPLSVERLKATLESRLLARYPRFRQRMHEPALIGMPHWEDDPHFDLEAHVHRIGLPAPWDEQALQTLVSDLMSTPLNSSLAPWEIHVIEAGAGGALVVRLHHAIADGLALVQVLLSLADTESDAPPPFPADAAEEDEGSGSRLDSARTGYRLVRGGMRRARRALHAGREMLGDRERLVDASLVAAASALSLSKLVLMPPDPKTVFRGPIGISKRAVWSDPIPLEEIKAIGRIVGGTVNDVLVAAAAGALRRYMEGRGQAADGLNIRAAVPVNLRPPDELDRLGNRFGFVFLDMPVGMPDAYRRLLVLKQRMDDLKDSPEAAVTFGMLTAMGLAPTPVEKRAAQMLADKATLIITNVPGPHGRLYLAGSLLRGFMFWIPIPAGLGLGISILSYCGQVTVGVATDAGLVPDPEAIIAAFHVELETMKEWTAEGEDQQGDAPES
jgi:diacylglycerol O-acyltransferase / wax synthase